MKIKAVLLAAGGCVLLAGGAQATGILERSPQYSPGTKPQIAPVTAPDSEQTAVVGALSTAPHDGDKEIVQAAKGAFDIGALYEAGANPGTLVLGAADDAGHHVGVAAARDGNICVVAIELSAVSGNCGTERQVHAGRVLSVSYDPDGAMQISGVVETGVTTVSFTGNDGQNATAPAVQNTYLLAVPKSTGGQLKLQGPGTTTALVIPYAGTPTLPAK